MQSFMTANALQYEKGSDKLRNKITIFAYNNNSSGSGVFK